MKKTKKAISKKSKVRKMDGSSLSPQKELLKLLQQRFPEIFAEGKVNGDKLKQSLGEELDTNNERYGLTWAGKSECFRHIHETTTATLKPVKKESVDLDTTENIFIEGDNLEVLKVLQKNYYGKIKMIYIDPPYNTGSDSFIYPDRFKEEKDDYELRAGIKDEEGLLTKDGFWRKNSKDAGRFHSNWLSMMYPRLFLARNLLRDDGVVFVSIDDNEVHNLRMIMNEIFGEENFINTVSLLCKVAAGASGGGEDKRLKKNLEYVMIFAKDLGLFNTLTHAHSEKSLIDVINDMKNAGESWKYTSILLNSDERQFVKTIKDGSGEPIDIYKHSNVKRTTIGQVCKDENLSIEDAYKKYFSKIFSDTNAQSSIRARIIGAIKHLGANEMLEVEYTPRSGKYKGNKVAHYYISNTVRRVIWLSEVAEVNDDQIIKNEKLGTLWDKIEYNNIGKEGDVPFSNGKKPIQLIQTCIKLLLENENSIVLDFFAGSCTTAHAVMQLNAEDGGNRKFICVQLAEPLNPDDKEQEVAYEFCTKHKLAPNIADIGKERIRRTAKKIKNENKGKLDFDKNKLDLGFKVFRLEESNFKQWRENIKEPTEFKTHLMEMVDNVKKGAVSEDMLFEIILKNSRFDLNVKIEEKNFDSVDYYRLADGVEIICLADKVTKKLVEKVLKDKPERFTCLDIAFKNNDQLKTNTALQMEAEKIEFKVI
ncbi:MAG: site-specific DNA-methyltransferase [Phycisphaerae bacterium]|nr:site-specific DNA-methyltransferase [Phycisphaerae bacterium]